MKLEQRLGEVLRDIAPESVLLMVGGDFPRPGSGGVSRWHTATNLADVPADHMHDLAIVDSAVPLPPAEIPLVLGRLRDLAARRVLVVVRSGAPAAWSRRAMIGYGYTGFGKADIGEATVTLYQFDIATYKHTPDWLNPDDWANPELWDRHRW